MKFKNLDNPWLIPVLYIVLCTYGAIFGFIFGPIFQSQPADGSDVYAIGNFTRNQIGGAVGLLFGFCLASGIIYQLVRQARLEAEQKETEGEHEEAHH